MTYNRNIVLLGLLAVMLGLSSCLGKSDSQRQTGSVSFSFRTVSEDDLEVKSTLNGYSYVWEDGDQVGLFIDNAYTPTTNSQATMSIIDGNADFEARINEYFAGDMLYAYYPYASGAERDGHKVRMSIPVAQIQESVGILNGNNFPMAARPYVFTHGPSANEEPILYFKHLASYLEFDVYADESEYEEEKVAFVQLDASSTIAGAFQFDYLQDFEDPTYSIIAGKSSTVKVNLANPSAVTSATGENKIFMAVAPGEYNELSVLVYTDKGVYRYQIPEGSRMFSRATVHRFALGLRGDNVDYRRDVIEYKDNYIGAQNNTSYGVYFDLETASRYGASDAVTPEVRMKTDLVFFQSKNDKGMCIAAPASSDLLNLVEEGIIDCYNWSPEEKNKTKISLLQGFTDEQYAALTLDQVEALTAGWETLDKSDLHRQNDLQPGNYYAFKTVSMAADSQVAGVVSIGVIKVVEIAAGVQGYVKFDYKISGTIVN